jgi:hypothetical protein
LPKSSARESDIAEICPALAPLRISDLAQKSGIARPSIHVRLQVIKKKPNLVFLSF